MPPGDKADGTDAGEPRSVRRRARRFDYAAKDALNRKLGRAGEEFIVSRERWYLTAFGRPDFASRVEHVSETQGDGLGYDVLSFDPVTSHLVYIEEYFLSRASFILLPAIFVILLPFICTGIVEVCII